MLEFRNRVWRPHMLFPANPKRVFATRIQLGAKHRIFAERLLMLTHRFLGNFKNADAFNVRRSTREVLVDKRAGQANGFKYLRAAIALIGGNTHLGHHLEKPF